MQHCTTKAKSCPRLTPPKPVPHAITSATLRKPPQNSCSLVMTVISQTMLSLHCSMGFDETDPALPVISPLSHLSRHEP